MLTICFLLVKISHDIMIINWRSIMAYFSYMRISTKEERAKQKYKRQEKALASYAKENGIIYSVEYREDESGKSFDHRKEWKKLESLAREGDTIIFKDISRFTREALNGYEKYMELMNKGIELTFIDNPTVSTKYIKELLHVAKNQDLVAQISLESTVKLLLIVELNRAEQERLTLSKRTIDGLAASDKKPGRAIGKLDKLTPELQEDIKKYLNQTPKDPDKILISTLLKKHKISRNTFAKYAATIANHNTK